jgi:hypothetical protein
MRITPLCEERERLHTEVSHLLSEWLGYREDLKMTSKNDASYPQKVKQEKSAHGKLKAAQQALAHHTQSHTCL